MGNERYNYLDGIEMTEVYQEELEEKRQKIKKRVDQEILEINERRMDRTRANPPFKLPIIGKDLKKLRDVLTETYNLSSTYRTNSEKIFWDVLGDNNSEEWKERERQRVAASRKLEAEADRIVEQEISEDLTPNLKREEMEQRFLGDELLKTVLAKNPYKPSEEMLQLEAEKNKLEEKRDSLTAIKQDLKREAEGKKEAIYWAFRVDESDLKGKQVTEERRLNAEVKESQNALIDWEEEGISKESARQSVEDAAQRLRESKITLNMNKAFLPFGNEIHEVMVRKSIGGPRADINAGNGILVWGKSGTADKATPLINELYSLSASRKSVTVEAISEDLRNIFKNQVVLARINENSNKPIRITWDEKTNQLKWEAYILAVRPKPLNFFQKVADGFMKMIGSRSDAGQQYDRDMAAYKVTSVLSEHYQQSDNLFGKSVFAPIGHFDSQQARWRHEEAKEGLEISEKQCQLVEETWDRLRGTNDQLEQTYANLPQKNAAELENLSKSMVQKTAAVDTWVEEQKKATDTEFDTVLEELPEEIEALEAQIVTQRIDDDKMFVAALKLVAQERENRQEEMLNGSFEAQHLQQKTEKTPEVKPVEKTAEKTEEKTEQKGKTRQGMC